MSNIKQDRIKEHEMIIMNVCEVCKTRYSKEEALEKNMKCCGQPLKQVEERAPMPFGP